MTKEIDVNPEPIKFATNLDMAEPMELPDEKEET